MAISKQQKLKIERVVNVFETGKPEGDYANISTYEDGPIVAGKRIKQITYGRSQTTEFGNLKQLIELYIDHNGVQSVGFQPYLNRIGQQPSLYTDQPFRSLLKAAGQHDPIMQSTQDEFFDLYYYQDALGWFTTQKFTEALSLLVIYDSFIHSGKIRENIRNMFPERTPANGGKEKVWIEQYVEARQNWLLSIKRLEVTIYRTKCFKQQIKNNNWDLAQTVNANGVKVA